MKKIILAESNPHHIALYRKIFENMNFDVELARTKEELMEELREIRIGRSKAPDLVVMDLMLGDGAGKEALRAIKKSHFTRHIPVFAVTNFTNPEFENEIKMAGIAPERYLMKSNHTPGEIADQIQNYFGGTPPRPPVRMS